MRGIRSSTRNWGAIQKGGTDETAELPVVRDGVERPMGEYQCGTYPLHNGEHRQSAACQEIARQRAALRAILPHLAETQDDAPAYRDAVRAVRDAVGGEG